MKMCGRTGNLWSVDHEPSRRLGRSKGFHDPADYADLARSDDAEPEELTVLATSEYPFVVEYVAANPRTPVSTLLKLVPSHATTHHERELLRSLVRNPAVPADVFRRVAALLMTGVDTTHPNLYQHAILSLFELADVP